MQTARLTSAFDYSRAFTRNLGLIDANEQERLRTSRALFVGVGGAGGFHAQSLARLGIGRFRIIDPDRFDIVNFNRQAGATSASLGEAKASVIADMMRSINPEAEVDAHCAALDASNVEAMLKGVDIVIDGIDFFALDARIILCRAAWRRNIPVVFSAPMGMSATLHVFAPGGVSFERYFDVRPGMGFVDRMVAFFVGTTPAMTQKPYFDTRYANPAEGYGPSVGPACMLCAGLMGVEVARILLHRPGVRLAPHYAQFDAYRHLYRRGYLWGGNRNPLQKLKRWIGKRLFMKQHPQLARM